MESVEEDPEGGGRCRSQAYGVFLLPDPLDPCRGLD